jgi:L-aspartate oxidase
VLEHTFLTDIVVADGRAAGVEVLLADGTAMVIEADAVVLASGGAGQLFLHTTNPAVTTGDGVAAAWRAGAELADVEFYQFHPTSLATGGSFLVSEAVRGEGAVLLNASGERFMLDVHPAAELAPRDVVARGIAVEMAAQDGEPVLLDATGLGAEFLARRFPTIDAACRRAGYDWSQVPIPVTPAAHYWMGGVATDTRGRSTVPGLYAVGEVACTGAHGANRLASNSLLESIVFAHRAARDFAGGVPADWGWATGRPSSIASACRRCCGTQRAFTVRARVSKARSAHWRAGAPSRRRIPRGGSERMRICSSSRASSSLQRWSARNRAERTSARTSPSPPKRSRANSSTPER